MTRVGLLVNPTAGGGRGRAEGLRTHAALTALGLEVIDVSGADADAAVRYAAAAVAEKAIDILVVVGGDGTTALGAQVCAGTEVPLALVGAGSGNDFARTLGIPAHHPEAAAQLVTDGPRRRVDLGRSETGAWFAGVLAAGLDARVNQRANDWAQVPVLGRTGRLRYTLALVREALQLQPQPFTVEVDGTSYERDALIVAIGNGTTYGGGMRICSAASLSDGQFDIVIVHPISLVTLLRVFPRVFSGEHLSHPAVEVLRGRSVRLSARSSEVLWSLADGDPFGPLPLTVNTVPGALVVVTGHAEPTPHDIEPR